MRACVLYTIEESLGNFDIQSVNTKPMVYIKISQTFFDFNTDVTCPPCVLTTTALIHEHLAAAVPPRCPEECLK